MLMRPVPSPCEYIVQRKDKEEFVRVHWFMRTEKPANCQKTADRQLGSYLDKVAALDHKTFNLH